MVGNFVAPGQVDFPRGFDFGPGDEFFYLGNGADPSTGSGGGTVVQIDGVTGEILNPNFINNLMEPGLDEGLSPLDVETNGNLFVSSEFPFADPDSVGTVREYDPGSGELLQIFDAGLDDQGQPLLSSPRGIGFGPDGLLYVSSTGTSSIVRFNPETGEFMDVFAEYPNLNGQGLTFVPDQEPPLGKASLIITTPESQLDSDPILDIAVAPEERIGFQGILDTSGLSGNLTSITIDAFQDLSEVPTLDVERSALDEKFFPDLDITTSTDPDTGLFVTSAVRSGGIGAPPDLRFPIADAAITVESSASSLNNDGLPDYGITVSEALLADGTDVTELFQVPDFPDPVVQQFEVQPTPVEITVTVESLIEPNPDAPRNPDFPDLPQGNYFSPFALMFHDGTFDQFDVGELASREIENQAEDGNGDPLLALLRSNPNFLGTILDSTDVEDPLPGAFFPEDMASVELEVDPSNRYFSYASMFLPSNDAFVGNDNPLASEIFDEEGNFIAQEIYVSTVWDAGTEFNDETPPNAATFPGDFIPETGVDENGLIGVHPGYNSDGLFLEQGYISPTELTAGNNPIARITITETPPVATEVSDI